ncbi:spore germination lipoprotein GerD [Robertmurraya massiliosenegalensis]|uniref:spore germination lipoprotein GerD n=1 Tax=Robertmurraya TaxID=2837507 RepID=UPI0039A77C5C
MRNKMVLLLIGLLVFGSAGCAQTEAGSKELDYEETKKMVVDILKTDDGKKALQEVMDDDGMKERLVMDQAVVSSTIQQSLTSEKGAEFWKKQFEDPKFAETFAKSMQQEHEKLIKNLMKDPEYQGMMIELMKDPELTKEVTELMKSKEYREHLQKVMTETFESPLYKAKIEDILLKAATEKAGGEEGGEEKKEEE